MRLRKYKKPDFPEGPFILIGPDGMDDGPFWARQLVTSDLPGEPWAIAGHGGSPKVFRVKKQKGDKLICEDGVFTIHVLTPEELAPPRGLPTGGGA